MFEHKWNTQIACEKKPGSRVCKLPYGYHRGSNLPSGVSNENFVKTLFNKKYKLPFVIKEPTNIANEIKKLKEELYRMQEKAKIKAAARLDTIKKSNEPPIPKLLTQAANKHTSPLPHILMALRRANRTPTSRMSPLNVNIPTKGSDPN
jgi:hypothetical protein